MLDHQGKNQEVPTSKTGGNKSETKRSRVRGSSLAKGIVGIFISLTLLFCLFSYLRVELFVSLLKKAGLHMLVLATLIYLSTYFFRAYRFNLIFGKEHPSTRSLFAVVSLHSFFNHILPFRTGEVSYLYFQKKYLKIPYSMASASLILARILDVVALITWACMLFPAVFMKAGKITLGYLWAPALMTCLFILFFYIRRWRKSISALSWVVECLPPAPESADSLRQRILRFIRGTIEHATCIIKEAPFIRLFLISMTLWLANFLYFFAVLGAFGQNISLLESIFPAYGATLGNLLPINGLGSLGTFEAGMAMGQVGIGTEDQLSVSLAFLTHAHVILTGMLAATVAWIYLKIRRVRYKRVEFRRKGKADRRKSIKVIQANLDLPHD